MASGFLVLSPQLELSVKDVLNIDNLQECMPKKGGTRPLRACGTRFISHKVAVSAQLIDRYEAYLKSPYHVVTRQTS